MNSPTTIYAERCKRLCIGREGENEARQVLFDLSHWRSVYGPGTVQLLVRRTGESTPYPAALTVEGSRAVWTVSAADTAIPGQFGKAELRYLVGDVLAKSETWTTVVLDALGEPSETPPEPQKGWVDQVLAAGAAAQEAAQRAENAAVNTPKLSDEDTWMIWDPDAGTYVDTGVYSGGKAPTIGANGNWIIGGVDTGVSASGAAGAPGKDGKDGADGCSPTASVTQAETGAVITITDKTGTTTATVKNGQDGAQGPAGADGQPGATPNIQIGTVTTLDPGTPATASMGGTAENPLLNLGIPKGEKGAAGSGSGGTDLSLGMTGAAVGQIAKITAVDGDGKPTEWEPVQLPLSARKTHREVLIDYTFDGTSTLSTAEGLSEYILCDGKKAVWNRDSNGNLLKAVRMWGYMNCTKAISQEVSCSSFRLSACCRASYYADTPSAWWYGDDNGNGMGTYALSVESLLNNSTVNQDRSTGGWCDHSLMAGSVQAAVNNPQWESALNRGAPILNITKMADPNYYKDYIYAATLYVANADYVIPDGVRILIVAEVIDE